MSSNRQKIGQQDDRKTSREDDRDHEKRMETNLRNALDEADPSEKDYYIRSALQDLVIKGEGIRS